MCLYIYRYRFLVRFRYFKNTPYTLHSALDQAESLQSAGAPAASSTAHRTTCSARDSAVRVGEGREGAGFPKHRSAALLDHGNDDGDAAGDDENYDP